MIYGNISLVKEREMFPNRRPGCFARLRLVAAAAITNMALVNAARASLLFDNISDYESDVAGASVTDTSSTPNTFMGDGYVLATGATDITGLDLFPVNLTGTTYTGLEIGVYVWGHCEHGHR